MGKEKGWMDGGRQKWKEKGRKNKGLGRVMQRWEKRKIEVQQSEKK